MIHLYDIPRGSIIFMEDDQGSIRKVYFDHLDGAYSYCLIDDNPEKILHLSAATPLEKVNIEGVEGFHIVED